MNRYTYVLYVLVGVGMYVHMHVGVCHSYVFPLTYLDLLLLVSRE